MSVLVKSKTLQFGHVRLVDILDGPNHKSVHTHMVNKLVTTCSTAVILICMSNPKHATYHHTAVVGRLVELDKRFPYQIHASPHVSGSRMQCYDMSEHALVMLRSFRL